jgi:hypothetical protein
MSLHVCSVNGDDNITVGAATVEAGKCNAMPTAVTAIAENDQ